MYSGDFQKILCMTKRGSHTEIIHACIKTSRLYRQFRALRLQAQQNDPDTNMDVLSFPKFLLAHGNGLISSNKEARVTMPPSTSLQLDSEASAVWFLRELRANAWFMIGL